MRWGSVRGFVECFLQISIFRGIKFRGKQSCTISVSSSKSPHFSCLTRDAESLSCLSSTANSPLWLRWKAMQQRIRAGIFHPRAELIWVPVDTHLSAVQRGGRNVQCLWEGWGEEREPKEQSTALFPQAPTRWQSFGRKETQQLHLWCESWSFLSQPNIQA